MSTPTYLANHFLIAMPTLMDPNFFHSVTYICEHSEEGALGVVINQPIGLDLGDLAEQLRFETLDEVAARQPIYRGGPVEADRGFILHRPRGDWDSTMGITDEIGLTTSNDIIAELAAGKGPRESLIVLGYAGWGAGQLEKELVENSWLSGPADSRIIFDTSNEKRWQAAAQSFGVDITQLSGEIGHA